MARRGKGVCTMQRNKNGIVVDIRSSKLSSATVLSQDYEMLELEFVEL